MQQGLIQCPNLSWRDITIGSTQEPMIQLYVCNMCDVVVYQ